MRELFLVLIIALLAVPVRVIWFVTVRAWWTDRWRAAGRLPKVFAGAGMFFIGLAACAWLAVLTVLVIRWLDPRFLGGSGQAGLMFVLLIAGLAIAMLIAAVIGDLLLLPLRLTEVADDVPHGHAAATSAGSTTPAGPRNA